MSEPTRRRRRWPGRLLIGALIAAAIFYGGGGVYFSNVLNERALDGASRRKDTKALEPDVEVVSLDDRAAGQQITLRGLAGAPMPPMLGLQGLRWEGGYAQVLDLGPHDPGPVVASFTLVTGEAPGIGAPAELDARYYPQDPLESEHLALQEISVPGPLGDYPAWVGTPVGPSDSKDTWAIVVHGNSLSAADGLRMVPILTLAGYPTLVATYRNDPGAPEDPSGKLRYGLTEWEDLEAMVQYALDQGSDGVVLDGYSMGGAVIMAFLQRSDLADQVHAVILDAPMLDFSETVDDNAAREEIAPGVPLPSSLTDVAKWIAAKRFDVDWDALNYLADTDAYADIPFLVFHGTADTTVPIATSREFAALLPDQVQLIEVDRAEHIESWNPDPDAYDSAVRAFLAANV
ncbi:MAG: alpha/beta hydrolase [Myxococcota bacterium]